ncbi:MAG: hypothetical protein ACLGI6_09990 [Gammaproteobacteria bacterium]
MATMPTETSRLRRVGDIDGIGNITDKGPTMWILFVEAGVALFLLVFIVWWTMYSGKKPSHPPQPLPRGTDEQSDARRDGD